MNNTYDVKSGQMEISDGVLLKKILQSSSIECDYAQRSPIEKEDNRPIVLPTKGRVVIFNQYLFDTGLGNRSGTQRDVDKLEMCFSELNIDVLIYDDLKKDQIFTRLRHESGNRKIDCLILIFLTHGGKEKDLFAKDCEYYESEIFEEFKGKLPGVPKIFIMQYGRTGPTIDADLPDNDMMVVYSTTKGECSYRHTTEGSLFITDLTQHLMNVTEKGEFLEKVIERLTRQKCTLDNLSQKPVYKSTMTKRIMIKKKEEKTYYNTNNTGGFSVK